jgi:DNA-3-methyladenine glycosylase II
MKKALNHLRKSDPIMAAIIRRVGPFKMSYRMPVFEMLVRAIVFQQLSTKAATTIFNRFAEAAGGELTPESIRGLSVGEMRRVGLSKQKAAYIRDLAEHTLEGNLDFAKLPDLTDAEVIERLTAVKGVGIWTAQMFLIFSLKRPNVLPVGDLGIKSAIKKAYKKRYKTKDGYPAPAHIEKIAKSWHPYCSVASWYLWRSLDHPAEP